jgi:GNAT superfamily N-acetyltransferase
MRCSIKTFADEDRDLWQELWRGYNINLPHRCEASHMDWLWQKILAPDSSIFGWYLENESGIPCGFALCALHETTSRRNPVWYINDVYVVPEERGKGYAQFLMKYVLSNAAKENASAVYWMTLQKNEAARQLYKSFAGESDWVVYFLDKDDLPRSEIEEKNP